MGSTSFLSSSCKTKSNIKDGSITQCIFFILVIVINAEEIHGLYRCTICLVIRDRCGKNDVKEGRF